MPALRFVFPHAPVRPVTINNGYAMRAWYDIIGIDRRSAEDFEGIKASAQALRRSIKHENARGVPTNRIVARRLLTGRRHGAAPRHAATRRRSPASSPSPAIYRCRASLPKARNAANQATPIFMAHGAQDPVVPFALGEVARRTGGLGYGWSGTRIPCRTRCARKKSRI